MSRHRHRYFRMRIECTHADGIVSHIDTLRVNPETFTYDRPGDWDEGASFHGVRSIRDGNRYVDQAGGEHYSDGGRQKTKWRGRCTYPGCRTDVSRGWPWIDKLVKGMYEAGDGAGEATVELRDLAAIQFG